MIIETRHIRYFIAVAEELHFRRAAERLGLAQPALSRAIKQLEHVVGTELFTRTNRRVELTAAGAVFLDGCRRSMSAIERSAERALQAKDGKIGHLSIGYTDFAISGILPEIIEQFRRELPGVTIDFVHMFTEPQIEALRRQTINFGFLTGPLEVAGYAHLPVQQDRLVVALPKNHPLATQDEIAVTDLAEQPFIMGMPREWRHFNAHLNNLFRRAGISPRIVQEAFNSEGIFGLVAANMGITILTESSLNYFRRGLIMRPLADNHPRVSTEAVWNPHFITPTMKLFIELLDKFRKE